MPLDVLRLAGCQALQLWLFLQVWSWLLSSGGGVGGIYWEVPD